MRKKHWIVIAAGMAMSTWRLHRNRKYPVCRELRFANKLVIPSCALGMGTAKLANRTLDQMRMKLPSLPKEIERRRAQVLSEDGTPIRLTIYRPEDLERAAPCLI